MPNSRKQLLARSLDGGVLNTVTQILDHFAHTSSVNVHVKVIYSSFIVFEKDLLRGTGRVSAKDAIWNTQCRNSEHWLISRIPLPPSSVKVFLRDKGE